MTYFMHWTTLTSSLARKKYL